MFARDLHQWRRRALSPFTVHRSCSMLNIRLVRAGPGRFSNELCQFVAHAIGATALVAIDTFRFNAAIARIFHVFAALAVSHIVVLAARCVRSSHSIKYSGGHGIIVHINLCVWLNDRDECQSH